MFYFENITKKEKAWAIASASVGLTSGLFFKGYPGSDAPGGIPAYLFYHWAPWLLLILAGCVFGVLLIKWVKYQDYRHLDSSERKAWVRIQAPLLITIVLFIALASIAYHPGHVYYLSYLANRAP